MNILLIEDDPRSIDYITAGFLTKGHQLDSENNGISGLEVALEARHDLIILERMLPGMDGLTILAELRSSGNTVPVLILSALSHVDERIKGLRSGGDDYMTKPFAFAELQLRAEKLMQRHHVEPETVQTHLIAGMLQIDLLTREVTLSGEKVLLQPKEFKLLKFLMEHADQTVSRALLFEAVWDYHFDPRTNVIEVHIAKLRRKFEELGQAEIIQTVRGAGYLLRQNP